MTLDKVIKQLEDLREHCRDYADKEEDEDYIWNKDVEALDIAIKMLRGDLNKKVEVTRNDLE